AAAAMTLIARHECADLNAQSQDPERLITPEPEAWHIVNHQTVSVSQLVAFLESQQIRFRRVPWRTFQQAVESGTATDPVSGGSAACLSLLRWMVPASQADGFRGTDLFQSTGAVFDSQKTTEFLGKFDLKCPAPNHNLLARSFSRLFREFQGESARTH
ncbi:MAG: hypothetical protein GY758_08330, partial [Fuerstiella sp.]|nr:hypothetical protein [Fuerstiella sp.]